MLGTQTQYPNQYASAAAATTADSGAAGAHLALADLVPTSSSAGDALLAQAASVQLMAKIALSADTGDVGWVSAGFVEVSGDIQSLPIANA